MTRAVRSRILKDANGDIGDHLRNHIHLTNCIHLKNHMLKQSPIMTDRSLMRDLIVLQRSRSLKDPSASPPSWNSASIADLLNRKSEMDAEFQEGRKSVGSERGRDARRLSISSAPLASLGRKKVVPGEVSAGSDAVAVSRHSSKSGARDSLRHKKGESIHQSVTGGLLGDDEDPLQGKDINSLVHEVIPRNSESKGRKSKHKVIHGQGVHVRTLSEQLHDIPLDVDMVSSNIHGHGKPSRVKRRKFRRARRSQAAPASRDIGDQKEMSVASNSFAKSSARAKYHVEEEEEAEYGDQSVSRAPRNGCGIPWNWSRIHDRSKTFLDMAGRSLSCGLSDSRSRKAGGLTSGGREIPEMPVASDHSSSATRYDGEAMPLLIEASESTDAGWVHDYSGELGIYADQLLKNEIDSDLASEGRSGNRHKIGRKRYARHQNLTQKYRPRTFRDLVGQNLVAHALSNAAEKRKVGLLYVFYGPHGTGKTSCARIFARSLNCHSRQHPKPCGHCNSCVAHDMGKSRNIREVGAISSFDCENILDLLADTLSLQVPSQYTVFIFDDCNTLSPECWSAISKVIDRAPRLVVFILVSSSLDVVPHIIISRCQKFFFPKIKDADIIYTLQWIASKEEVEIDKDALKLIASRSDGSLRDAEMTLEQLSLLGQRISVPLVQEMVGLISDEKLVDLLDLALSADTVNTVKNLRVIMETGVEPLALMSQLATVITDILAGSYDLTKERDRRKFFRRQPLSKEDMEKLRQALKTLSEAERQLRTSNDRVTWLTAALLQLAPDQQYMLPSSSNETSFNHSPLTQNKVVGRKIMRQGGEHGFAANDERGLSKQVRLENLPVETVGMRSDRKRNIETGVAPQKSMGHSRGGFEEIWLKVLEKIQNRTLREFLYQEGKLVFVSLGAAPTVQLMFSSHNTKSQAEKFTGHILQAFESVLGSPVTVEIRCEPTKETTASPQAPLILPTSKNASSQMARDQEANAGIRLLQTGRSEIVEVPVSPKQHKANAISHNRSATAGSICERRLGERSQSKSIVRSKVSLAHVIQQAEGCTQQTGWSKRKAVSIAEKLEQENLRLEPRYRSLLCWKASKATGRKISRLRIRTRRPNSLLKFVSCGKCMTTKSPR